MVNSTYQNLVIFLSTFLCLLEGIEGIKDIEEGEPCKLRGKNGMGICAPYTTCKHLIEGQPKICTYNANEAIVCCPKESDDRISVKKCREYKALAVEKTSYSTGVSTFTLERKVCEVGSEFIVGGTKADKGEFPHMAAIGFQTSEELTFQCGGSLISENFVLSAAHCRSDRENIKPSIARFGAKTLIEGDTANDYKIIRIISHPEYNFKSKYNDIVLFELESRVRFSDFVRPACLQASPDISESSLVACGFGLTEDDELSSDLLKVTLQVLDNDICEKTFKKKNSKVIAQGMIGGQMCIGDLKENKDTCGGDSGGPVQTIERENKCVYTIIGITSFGFSICGSLTGAIYTKVSSYLDWIEPIVWPIN